MHDLEQAIKVLIVETLQLEDTRPEDIETETPLFGDGLGLDSIDALELGVALKKRFGLVISSSDPAIGSLARLLSSQSSTGA